MPTSFVQLVPPFTADAVHPEIMHSVMNRPRHRRRGRRIRSFWKRVQLGGRVIDAIINNLPTLPK